MDFNSWELNESKQASAQEVIDQVKSVFGDKYGNIYLVPNFETFKRDGEPEQRTMLVGTDSGESFSLNFAGDSFYSVDVWNKDSVEPVRTIYAGGNDLTSVLSAVFAYGQTNESDDELLLYVDSPEEDDTFDPDAEVKKRPKKQLKSSAPKPKTEFDKEAASVNVVPSVSKRPDRKDPQLKSDYEFQDPDTIFDDLRIYTKMVINGTQPSMLITGSPGVGKCHRRGDKLLMYDLTYKNVEDVQVGDLLMGDDSNPRYVISLANGTDEIFEIRPKKGNSFFVNGDHILVLVDTDTNAISEVSVYDYLKLSKSKQSRQKLYRVCLEFAERDVEIDPYWLGLWLGDGSSHSCGITIAKNENEILEAHLEYASSLNLNMSVSKDKRNNGSCATYTPTSNIWSGKNKYNILLEKLRYYGLSGNIGQDNRKFIPIDYLKNSRDIRLNLLAGLLDSDGCKIRNGVYEITQKNKTLSDNIALLARSLGYYVNQKETVKTIKKIGFSGIYYRLTISGAHDVPCRLKRKISHERKQVKNIARTGFEIIPIGVDDYFGFTLSGNGRYLMDDFIVTHNTFIVTDELKKAGMKKDVDYYHVKGKSTAAGMYQTLYEHNGKLIVFDDMDSIFKDDNAVNILKGALDSDEVREIAWITSRPMKTASGEDVPQRFDFTGRVIFISNLAQKNVDSAIKTRSFVVEVALSPADTVKYIEGLFDVILPYERVSTKRYALNAIKAAADENPNVQINMRTFLKAVKIVKNVKDKNVVDRMIIQQCSYK